MPKRKVKEEEDVSPGSSVSINKKSRGDSVMKSRGVGDNSKLLTIPPSVKVVWQLEDEAKATWHLYHEDIQEYLSTAAVTGKRNVRLTAGPRTQLMVDMVNSVQVSSKGMMKRVRGLVETEDNDLFCWEARDGDQWSPLHVGVSVKLEQVRDISSSVTVSGVEYDLEAMVRKSDNASIRREKQLTKKITKASITFNIKLSKTLEDDEDEPAAKKSKLAAKSSKASIKDDPEEESKPVMKSVLKKGLAPVDGDCPGGANYKVFCEGRDIWDVMLNQTNIQNNNNKFYLFQLLEHDNNGSFAVWMRWGRVGYRGQTNFTSFGSDLVKAKAVFTKKFSDKTYNDWEDRDKFEKRAGKYDLVKIDYNNDDDGGQEDDSPDVVDGGPKTQVKEEIKESKLPQSVQDLISLICNIKTMEEAVVEMQYDTKKAPLGKITVEQIRAGYSALKTISECVEAGRTSGGAIIQACNDFYTRIPHEFGFRVPPIIRTPQEVKKKLELLETLSDIQVALKILSSAQDCHSHPIDRKYDQLKIDIAPMDKKTKEWELVEKSIKSTHASTHNLYTMDLVDLFSLDKSSERQQFANCGNTRLLYHGSRLSNWAGILGNGLKIAPPEAPSTGYMFGKGVYFADMSSKSANYCYTTRSQPLGLLLICEVALGDCNKLINADYNADKLPSGKKSVMGLGRVEPARYEMMDNGLELPMGPARNTDINKVNGYTLNYNEFIVYDTKQIKMKYLAKIKFNYKL